MTAMVKGDWSSMSDATVAGLRARPLTLSGHRHARGAPQGHGRVRSAERAAYRPTAVPAPSLVATVSQRLVVEAVPELAPGSGSTTTATAKSGAATVRSPAQVGTPGTVPSISFPVRTTTSIRASWGKPSDGGRRLTGFGLLFWRTSDPDPAYSSALVKGAGDRSHVFTGLQPDTTYKFRIHACNGADSCGWWTEPPKEVRTLTPPPEPTPTPTATAAPVGRPDRPHTLSFDEITTTSARANWRIAANTGGVALTGFGLLRWPTGTAEPPHSEAIVVGDGSATQKAMTGLTPATTYVFKMRACNGPNRCSDWIANQTFTTLAGTVTPGRVTNLRHSSSGDNSVTLAWSAPGNSAAAAVTSYRVQNRPLEAAWPGGFDVAQGAGTTTFTVSQLVDGTIYEFQVRACNAAGCGAWTKLLHSDGEIVAGHKVGNASLIPASASLAVGGRLGVGIHDIPKGKVAYAQMYGAIQPAGRCSSARSTRAVARAPSASTGSGYYDSVNIEGCAPGGIGWLRVVNAAETELYARATIRVGVPPGKVGRPTVTAGNASLDVAWVAPSAGDRPITHYDLQYRAGTSGDWTLVEDITLTSYTITGLTNGTSYQVQVRAVSEVGEGVWSDSATGTPLATAPAPTETAVPTTPVDAACPETSDTATAAGPPQNLDVVPQPQRRILLCWTPVTPVSGDTSYFVEATLNPTADTDGDRMWATARTRKADDSGPASTTDTAVIVDLTDVLLYIADRGLTTQQSVGFRIRARISPSRYEYSNMVVVVDSPIVAASVFRSNRQEAHVSWRSARTVLLDDDYADGEYDLRYRLVTSDHTDRGWTPGSLGSTETDSDVSSGHIIRRLEEDKIYAIQLVYRADNSSATNDANVYAARNVYVQTFDGPPIGIKSESPVIFAGFPMRNPMKTTTFEYRVCTETFPTGLESDWVDFIKHAFGQWELATNSTVISMRYNADPCTDYATDVTSEILETIRTHVDPDEPATGVRLEDQVARLIDRLRFTKIKPLSNADSRLNEVLMLDDVEALGLGPEYKSRVVFIYSEFGSDVGYLGGGASDSVARDCWTKYRGCATSSEIVDSDGNPTGDGFTTDIFVLRSKANHSRLPLPGGDTQVNRSDVKLSTCPSSVPSVYGVLVHEAGHALGLRSAVDGSEGHPRLIDSVMSGGDYGAKCAPYPADVLAIRALYEAR